VLDAPVSSLMTGHRFAAVEPSTETMRVLDLMIDRHVGAVPVIDDRGSLVGLVSYLDLLRAWPFPPEVGEDPSPDVVPTIT
jgi:CBS domain-containing protein